MNRLSRLLLLSGSLGLFLLQTPLGGQEIPSPSQILECDLGVFESVAFFPQDLSKISGVITWEWLDHNALLMGPAF